jgi:archaeal type IV pilus assembly protein PilA
MNFRKINKFRRDVRAISPVIATLLMIAIAVVASLVTYAWVMGYMNFTTEKTGKAIQIQSIAQNVAGGNAFTIYVQNVGDSPLSLSNTNSVFIDGAVSYPAGTWTTPTTPLTLTKGETGSYIATGASLTAGVHSITFKVTTTDGTFSQITQQFTIA